MVKNHMKRISAPKTWAVRRKQSIFITRPNPGGHSQEYSMPLSVLLLENLQQFRIKKEVKYALNNKEILVNGKPASDPALSVGLLDTVAIPKVNKHYRLVINEKNKLTPVEISAQESGLILVKVLGKTSIKGGDLQISTTGGRTIKIPKKQVGKTNPQTGSSILLEVPVQKAVHEITFEKGRQAYIFEGRHRGKIVNILDVTGQTMHFEENKIKAQTKKRYAIIVGKEKSEITIIR